MSKLGRFNANEIYLEDSYKAIKDIPDKSIDLIITDPPYDIGGLHAGTGILKERNLSSYVEELRSNDLGVGIDYAILDDFCRIMKYIYIYMVQ